MAALTIRSEVTSRLVTVRFAGRMDGEGVRQIQEEFDEVTSGKAPVIVDLTAVTFLESLGVALLVRLAKRLRAVGSSVAVIPGPGPVAHILGIARLDRVLNVAFSEAEAVESLGFRAR